MNLSSHYNEQSAQDFIKLEQVFNLSYLIYRDIPDLLKSHLLKGKALDFGCGPGISTRFLAQLGFDVTGVDINKNMLKEAFLKPDGIPYAWIEHGKLPFADHSFDLVLSVMVLLEMPSADAIREATDEITRVLKPGGIFLAVVGSEDFHKQDWLNKSPVDLDRNRELTTGDVFYTSSRTTGILFRDHFYSHMDYLSILNSDHLEVIQHHKALGLASDGRPWNLEMHLNPYSHYVCKKLTRNNEV